MHKLCTVGGGHAESSTVLFGAQVLRHVLPRPETLIKSIDTHVHVCLHTQTHAHAERERAKDVELNY